MLKTLILLNILISISSAQNQHIIMTYNILNYPGTDTVTRNSSFRTIFNAIRPDIIVVQEMTSQSGVNGFLNNILNSVSSGYSAGVFIDGFDSDNAIFYRSALFNFISNTPIRTNLRDINEFKMVYIPTGDTLRIFSVHLKAGESSSEQLQRANEIDSLRKWTNMLRPGSNFIVTGDFNIYSSAEPAYQKLLNQSAPGYVYDIYNIPGVWNQSSYAVYHTQSPRVRSFGGGSTGGMDDRFDIQFISQAVKDSGNVAYIEGSSVNYGNDGNHYNDSINKPPNNAVSQEIADALHNASDHIPVYASYSFTSAVVLTLNLKTFIEAIYNGSIMTPDSITVELRTSFSPFAVVDTAKILLDSSGDGICNFHQVVNGVPYYLVIKHLTGIETWSALPINFSSNVCSYDFTTGADKAYGNNLVSKEGEWCIYSGDINQDNFINLQDLNEIMLKNIIGFEGTSSTDLNKDLFTEIEDLNIVYKNKTLAVHSIKPSGF